MKLIVRVFFASLLVSGVSLAAVPASAYYPIAQARAARSSLAQHKGIGLNPVQGSPRRFPAYNPVVAGTGSSWLWANPTPQGNTLYGSVTGNGLSVAVGGGGTLYTSNASGNWVSQNTGTSNNLYAVTYGGGLYVAVGQADSILTSPDGIHWTAIPVSDTTQNLYSITYNGTGTFVAAGTNGTVFYSNGGGTWTEGDIVASGTTDTATSVAFGNGTFVIVAHTSSSVTKIFSSTDGGVTWTSQSTPTLNDPSVYAAFNGSEFVAMGLNVAGTFGGSIMTSTDGVTWSAQTSLFPTTSFPIAITTAGTMFVVMLQSGKSGTAVTTPIDIETSPDGMTWSPQPNNNLPAPWSQNIPKQISYTGSQYLVVGADAYIATSTDLQNWSYLSPVQISTYNHLRGVHWINTQFFAVGDDDTVLTSPDGISWTNKNIVVTTPNNLRDIAYNGARYVSVGSNGTVLTSSDGINWTAAQITPAVPSGTSFEALVWSGSLFVAVGTSGIIYTSPDGLTWTQQSSGTLDNLWGIAWTGSRFVVVSDSTTDNIRVLISSDGVHWSSTPFNPSYATSLFGIHWTGTELVAAGGASNSSGKTVAIIATSPDGISWTIDYSTIPDIFADAILNGTQYAAVGQDTGYIYASTDGTTWTVQTPTFQNVGLEKLAMQNGQMVATGYAGAIFRSVIQPPTASNGSVSTPENTAVNGTLQATGSGTLTFAIASQPAHGTVTLTNAATGAFTYTPASAFTGNDSFTFTASNSAGTSNTATESVTVNAPGGGGTPPPGSGGGGGPVSLLSLMVLVGSATLLRKRKVDE